MTSQTTTLSSLMQPDHVAVVTGASSGIGRAAAMQFAQKGMRVFAVDFDEKELTATCESLHEEYTSKNYIVPCVVDVSNADAVNTLANNIFAQCETVHILMNNAGIGLGGGPLTDLDTVHRVMGVNTYGPIHACLAFIPRMKQAGQPGIIINTGSKQGITMPPGNLTYNMSKAALKCYTEGLEYELSQERRGDKPSMKLRAALLIPGWVNTSILLKSQRHKAEQQGELYDASTAFFHEGNPQPGAWMPKQVIDFMIQELDLGRFYVVCPDNDVIRETDNLRMLWTANDIVQDRPPLSRWHPDYKEQFEAFMQANIPSKSK